MSTHNRVIKIGEQLRYAKSKDSTAETVDGLRNFFHITQLAGTSRLQLDKGIDTPAMVHAADGLRRPALLIRSTPRKAGSADTPWHDVFDLENGHVRYYGDHRPETKVDVGTTSGSKAMLTVFEEHQSTDPAVRVSATPLLLFRSIPMGRVPKGYVEFCGLGVIERTERVVQQTAGSRTFVNYVFDIALLDLAQTGDGIDWTWINARRNPELTAQQALEHAPKSWRVWVQDGQALTKVRRRVATSRLRKPSVEKVAPTEPLGRDLDRIYRYFETHKKPNGLDRATKLDFEHLASAIAARILKDGGGKYREGWVTRSSGDGGADFVGRLDIGSGTAVAKLVVLGQAKCVQPDKSISADNVARVVARLQRGWIGVYVTTGVYSTQAQEEIFSDKYPMVLVNGRRLATEVRNLANTKYDGDIDLCIEALSIGSAIPRVHRRPEEILLE
ncbi:restriction endonuclease [Actinokineospora spheciospongiae]|uniref:restriction endonuclease n=1 Tax=Actinokineospora spheciospongiae TaxID=909613 RepID=UPI000D7102E1|nr:restriction endonuclease [Actinokineospora spheciospongiae]PWW65647.1 restriction endonuclease [Actinokineospora spheciospongiae]